MQLKWLRRRALLVLLAITMLLPLFPAHTLAAVDPNVNIAPTAISKVSTHDWSASYPGSNAVDGVLSTRWACRTSDGPTTPPTLTLTFAEPKTIYKTGISVYSARVSNFSVEYYSGSSWLPAFSYSGAGLSGNGSATPTESHFHYWEFNPVTSTQFRLKINDTNDPSVWEWRLYETFGGAGIFSAIPRGSITPAGGNVTIDLDGNEFTGKTITATVNGVTYPATIKDNYTAEVTVSVPTNTGAPGRSYQVTYKIDDELSGVTTRLVVPGAVRLMLQYDRPAADSADGWKSYSLPIGNGFQGANVFGRVNSERVQLSEESLWTGGPINAHDPNVRGAYIGKDYVAWGNANYAGDQATPDLYKQARQLALGTAANPLTPPVNTAITGSASTPMYNMFPRTRDGLGNYQNFSEVYIPLRHDGATITESAVSNYLRWLDIENATSGVEYTYNGVTYTREYLASYPDHVVVAKFGASENGKVSLTLNPTIPHMTALSNTGDVHNRHLMGKIGTVTATDTSTIDLSGYLRQNGLKFAAQFKVIRDGGTAQTTTISGNGAIQIDGANSVTIIMSYGTDYVNDFDKRYRTGEDPMVLVSQRAQAAAAKEYASIRQDHIDDYKSIFDNFELDLGGPPSNTYMTDALLTAYRSTSTAAEVKRFLEELYVQYGRYLIIASSRAGSLPANLQGVWNSYQLPNWQSDYHLNINLQMNYWPSNTTNMKETLYALVDYIDNIRKPGRTTAYHMYGVGNGNFSEPNGFVAHVSSNIYGFTGIHNANAPTRGFQAQYSPESAMWMVQNVYNMYQYYPDEAYLRNRIYPIMKEAVLFYSNPEILVYDPASQRMVMSPTVSSEHGPSWAGATFQQTLLWQLFNDFIEAAEILDVDPGLRQTCADLIPLLDPIQVQLGSGNLPGTTPNLPGIKEWWWEQRYGYFVAGTSTGTANMIPWFNQTTNAPATNRTDQHRHLSHLVGLFPGNMITDETPEWLEAAKNSVYVRGDGATGWSRGLKTNLQARVGDGNQAYLIFNGLLSSATLTNLWDYHDGSPAEGSSNTGIFQLDGNSGGASGVVEMLLQSHAGYIKPLPALPDAWPAGSVKGLTARGGFVVDLAWSDKKLDSLEIASSAGEPCSLKYGNVWTIKVTEKGGSKVPVTVDTVLNTVTFPTQAGKSYVITFDEEAVLISVINPSATVIADNGSPKTAAGLGLPAQVELNTDRGVFIGGVTWNAAAASYDPLIVDEQEFTVTGTAILPSYIVTNGASLEAVVSVKVLGDPDAARYIFESKIVGGSFVSTLKNNSIRTVSGYFIIAIYDLDGRLAHVENKPFSVGSGNSSGGVYFDVDAALYPEDEYNYLAFCWDTNYVPLMPAVEPLPSSLDRQKLNFNANWQFTKAQLQNLPIASGKAITRVDLFPGQDLWKSDFDDSEWKTVSTPHTFNDEDTFRTMTIQSMMGDINMYTGKVWYRKHFVIGNEYADKKIFIEFEAARQAADVYLNDVKLTGRSENGFMPFGYDLTPYINFGGDNVLAVMVDNTCDLMIQGTSSYIPWHNSHWHPTHGGLYRNVYLYITDKLHVTLPLYSFMETQGTYVYAKDISDSSARIFADAEVKNEYDTAKDVIYSVEIKDEQNNTVLTMSDRRTLAAGEKYYFSRVGTLLNPKLWSPDYPYLYTVYTTVSVDGEKARDTTETPLGIRVFQITNTQGFWVNGNRLLLRGWGQKPTNEWAGLGAAYPDWMQDYVSKLMKGAGGNFLRSGHSAAGAATIKAADRNGIIVLQPGVDGEGPSNASTSGYPAHTDKAYDANSVALRERAFRDMIIYFRNNPSIAFWETSNKVWDNTTLAAIRNSNMDRNLFNIAKQWDPDGGRSIAARRPGTYNQDYIELTVTTEGDWELKAQGKPGVEGEYNREEAPRRAWDQYTPGYTNYVSQFATGSSYHMTAEQFAANQAIQFDRAVNIPEHSGGGNWIFSDSTSHGRVMSEVNRASGEVDAVMLPKEAYWSIKVLYEEEPGCYLIGHWNYPAGTRKSVYVMTKGYGNNMSNGAARVELYVNGTPVGNVTQGNDINTTGNTSYGTGRFFSSSVPSSFTNGRHLFTFTNVDYVAGEIKAIAYDAAGNVIGESSKSTHGAVAGLKLTPHVGPKGLIADGSDVMFMDVEAVDAQGNRCLTFEGRVDFTYSGPTVWRGGYNSGIINSTNNTYLNLECGINRVALRSTLVPGEITVTATLANGGFSDTCSVVSKDSGFKDGFTFELPQTYAWLKTKLMKPFGPGPTGGGTITPPDPDNSIFQNFGYSGGGAALRKTNAQVGDYAYTDDAARFTTLPTYLRGTEYIQMANEMKSSTGTVDFINFSAREDMTVYVAFSDLNSKASWLDGFTLMPDKVVIGSENFSVYAMDLDESDGITLGNNTYGGITNGSIYVVFGVSKNQPQDEELLYLNFNGMALNENFNVTSLPNPLLPELTLLYAPTTARCVIREKSATDQYFGVTSTSGNDTKPVFTFPEVTSGKVKIEFKALFDPSTSNNTGSIAIAGGPISPTTAPDNAFMLFKVDGTTVSHRSGDAPLVNKNIAGINPSRANEWIDVVVELDVSARLYKFWINGTQITANASHSEGRFRFRHDSTVGSVWGVMPGKGGSSVSMTCIDDIRVTKLAS